MRSSDCQMASATTTPERGKEQAIDGKRLAQQEDDAGQQLRRRHLQCVGSPDQPHRLADDQRQSERHHQEGVRVAPVEAAQNRELEGGADPPTRIGASTNATQKVPVARTSE